MLDHLTLLVRAGHPVLSVHTRDEVAGAGLVRQAADALGLPLYEWSATRGLEQTRPDPADPGLKGKKAADALEHAVRTKGTRALYLFRDLGPHAKEPVVVRLLKDLHAGSKAHVILLDGEPLPEAVARLAVPLRLPLPTAAELEQVVRDTFKEADQTCYEEVTSTLTARELDQLAQTLRGLTKAEAGRVVMAAIHDDFVLSAADLPRVVEWKRNLLEGAGTLEAVTVGVTPDEVGGLATLKGWLAKRRGGLTPKGRAFGLEPPRGILLLGVQGCGKSLCAKVVAADWRMPLLRMDPGVLYGKYIGESENRLRDTLAQAEAMAPAVLWIDEIEKAFASASAASADGGLSQRMFGTLLSWMQDHASPIFMVATANNIESLPPELMRKGRFDEVFFVDLPDPAARRHILGIHLKRRKREPKAFDLDAVSAAADGFSGAELEQAVKGALYAAFAAGEELGTSHLLAEVRGTRPLSVLMGEKVDRLRRWAHDRCVPAD